MNEQDLRPTLATVLAELLSSEPAPSHAALTDWIARYPDYAAALTEFAADWAQSQWLPDADEADATAGQPDPALAARGRAVVQGLLAQSRRADTPLLEGLLAAARQRGLLPQQLAAAARLSIPLLAKLDRRLIRFASIPGQVIADLGQALECGTEAVGLYLQGAPRQAAGNYLAHDKPQLPQQEDFFAAVRADRLIGEPERRRLLALDRP